MAPNVQPSQGAKTHGRDLIAAIIAISCMALVSLFAVALVFVKRRKKTFGYPALSTSSSELRILQQVETGLMCTTKPAYVQDGVQYNTFDSPDSNYGISESLRMYEFNIHGFDDELPSPNLNATTSSPPMTPSSAYQDQSASGRINLSIQYSITEARLSILVTEITSLSPLVVVISATGPSGQQTDQLKKWSEIRDQKIPFEFIIYPEDVDNARLQVNVLLGSADNFSLGTCLNAESCFDLSELDDELDEPIFYNLPLVLKEKADYQSNTLSDVIASPEEQSPSPQLLIGLMYISSAGKLVVSVLKGRNYGIYCSKPDTFVKVTQISPYGEEIDRRTTQLYKQSASPLFDETFVFQVPHEELDFILLTVTVFCILGIWQRKIPIGVVTLGAKTGDKDIDKHWQEMKTDQDETIAKWHRLVEP